jgi:hypothetical protein
LGSLPGLQSKQGGGLHQNLSAENVTWERIFSL